MPEFVLKDCVVKIGASTAAYVNLSDHVRGIAINYSAELQDKTAMGDGARAKIAGLKNWTMTIGFNQDFAADKVDATLFPLVGSTALSIFVKPTTAAVSATNPAWKGSALLGSYDPISGSIGDLSVTDVAFESDGDMTRQTTAT